VIYPVERTYLFPKRTQRNDFTSTRHRRGSSSLGLPTASYLLAPQASPPPYLYEFKALGHLKLYLYEFKALGHLKLYGLDRIGPEEMILQARDIDAVSRP
jgi:hypothetical protein